MRWFTRGRDAWNAIVQHGRVDPYLLITDWIGTQPRKTSLVRNIRNRYPRVPIILHSASATLQDVVKLQNQEMLIDVYVAKSEGIERLLQVAVDLYRRYAKDPVLSTVRSYLARCTDPYAPFTVIGNKEYSLVEMYQQMSQQTAVGEEALDVWRLLLEDAINES
jgi:CheY-like chemotaxis protein